MKSILFRALLVGASVSAAVAGAQTTARGAPPAANSEAGSSAGVAHALQASDSSRVYDSQALRFESRWGSADIIRGADGTAIGTVGWFRDFDVEKLVESSPHAVVEARAFKTNNFRGSLVGGLGALTLVTGAILTANSSNNAASPILMIFGAGAVVWGAQHLNAGFSALSRSLWWYNRDLVSGRKGN
jgi:hypothetical protein